MKTRFSSFDLICSVTELQKLIGMRVHQVYDIDSKTYLIRLQLKEQKAILLLESGIRIHTTSFEWPKNMAPSGFSMKLRKHIKNKRLEKLSQMGMDRIVDLQFGCGEAAYHVILELYDKGNIVFTDFEYLILNILRPHTGGDTVKFAVRENYPIGRGKQRTGVPTKDSLNDIFNFAKPDETVKKTLNLNFEYGPAVIEHCLLCAGLLPNTKIKDINVEENMAKLNKVFEIAETIIDTGMNNVSQGYIVQKKIKRPKETEDFMTHEEFHPTVFEQHKNESLLKFTSFDKAVDEFFSQMESQKIDLKGVHQEKCALKKLNNVKKDHEQRLIQLEKSQCEHTMKAELISRNQELVDDAISAIRRAIASQMSWPDIGNLVKEATSSGDKVASVIKFMKLNVNHITLLLTDPYREKDESGEPTFMPTLVDIDLDLSAFANAKKYYDKKRHAFTKQKKTLESQDKAFKSAERKTKQTLREVKTGVSISKARKVFWFEKFYWFISSENYLVIGGRDQQQNELIVKRYLKANDIYVHAGIVGASSVVIKNPSKNFIPPKTLNEAGAMAMCYSTAWEAKIVTSAWWVRANQVSKTAPTGEYLTTGSFMIRGKKNFLPQCHLIMGFTFLFRLEESFIERHLDERKKKEFDESAETNANVSLGENDIEIDVSDSDREEPDENNRKTLSNIMEEQELTFPETEIHVEHNKNENKVEVKLSKLGNRCGSRNAQFTDPENENVIYFGDDTPVILKQAHEKTESSKKTSFVTQNETNDSTTYKLKQPEKQKRGQKSRLKKIKEKYKDQDEEERELRMQILQGCSQNKVKNNGKKDGKKSVKLAEKTLLRIKNIPPQVQLLSVDEDEKNITFEDEDEEEKLDLMDTAVTVDTDLLNSLTGQPLVDDELLFAVPIVAPYNAIINYKYKVKLTPGTGKRGKSAKAALNIFLKDKNSTQREKDLLKFVKDQDIARNFPGKVKISAPMLNKVK